MHSIPGLTVAAEPPVSAHSCDDNPGRGSHPGQGLRAGQKEEEESEAHPAAGGRRVGGDPAEAPQADLAGGLLNAGADLQLYFRMSIVRPTQGLQLFERAPLHACGDALGKPRQHIGRFGRLQLLLSSARS